MTITAVASIAGLVAAPELIALVGGRVAASRVAKLLRTPEGRAQLKKLLKLAKEEGRRAGRRVAVEVVKRSAARLEGCVRAIGEAVGKPVVHWLKAMARCADWALKGPG